MSTILEVNQKEQNLKTTIETTLLAVKSLIPATPEFDEAYTRYLTAKSELTHIPELLQQAKLSENSDKIKSAGLTIAEGIKKLIEGLGVKELLGSDVLTLNYHVETVKGSTDAQGVVTADSFKSVVVFNPKTIVKSTTGKADKSAAKTDSDKTGHNTIVNTNVTPNVTLSLTKFVNLTATEAEKLTAEYKYPHTRVDSLPKFNEYIKSHNLTGYTYVKGSKKLSEAEQPVS